MKSIDMAQYLTQAMLPNDSPFLQLPYITKEILQHFEAGSRSIKSMQDFFAMKKEEQRQLLKTLSDEQFNEVIQVASQIPTLYVAKAEYKIAGENAIVPSALVTLSIKFKCGVAGIEPKMTNEIPEMSFSKKKKKLDDDSQAHCSMFPTVKKPSFIVFLANSTAQRMICMEKKVGLDNEHVVRLQFQSPPSSGKWNFDYHIRCDSFVGGDIAQQLQLVVESANALPPPVEYNDETTEEEYSEDEQEKEQKAIKKKSKKERDEFEDSTDSDDNGSIYGPEDDFVE
jgi:translocation protein SEC63